MAPLGYVVATCVLVSVACGGGNRAKKTDREHKPKDYRARWFVIVADRHAPVPKASNKKERVVFLREGSVWIMHPSGAERTAISVRSHESADEAPAMSPTGDAIAYVSTKQGQKAIYVVKLSEMLPKKLTDGSGGGDTDPAWSPDGKRLVFVRGDPEERRDLYIVDTSGGTPTLLLKGDDDNPKLAGTPAWSPKGDLIVFSTDRRQGRGTGLWLIDVRTHKLSRLTVPRPGASFVRDRFPAWSPNGKRIAFASNRHVTSSDQADDYDIYAINPDGSGLTRLTADPGIASDPTYSPDGKRIMFTSTRDRKNTYELELYVMAAEGGKQRRMTRDERPQNGAPSAGLAK